MDILCDALVPTIEQGQLCRLQSLKVVATCFPGKPLRTDIIKKLLCLIATRGQHLPDLVSVELRGSLEGSYNGDDDDASSPLECLLTTPGLNLLPITKFVVGTRQNFLHVYHTAFRFITSSDPSWNLQVLGATTLNGGKNSGLNFYVDMDMLKGAIGT